MAWLLVVLQIALVAAAVLLCYWWSGKMNNGRKLKCEQLDILYAHGTHNPDECPYCTEYNGGLPR
jgi:hypothetical protein